METFKGSPIHSATRRFIFASLILTVARKRSENVKSGRLKALIDPAGRRVEYKYDESGDLVKASLEDRTLGYAYSSHSDPKQAHNLTSLTDPRGLQALALNYDSQDKLTSLGRGIMVEVFSTVFG